MSRVVNVLHILGTAEVEATGIARIVAMLAGELQPSRYRIHVCFLGPSGPLVDYLRRSGAVVRCICWKSGVRDPIGAFRFWHYLHEQNISIVHEHRMLGTTARSMRSLIGFSKARLIVHIHNASKLSVGNVPTALRHADRVIAVSRTIAASILHLDPVIAYPGVPVSAETVRKPQSADGTIVIGTACRLVPPKGVMTLVHAMADLNSEFKNIRLEIAGCGPQQIELERAANRLNLTDQVRFLGWQNNLRGVLRNWHIFALPSELEGFPIAVLEAMSEGVAVVVSDVGGLSELLEDGSTGFLVPANDQSALVSKLRRLVLEPQVRSCIADAGRKRVTRDFSVKRMVAEIKSVYDALS